MARVIIHATVTLDGFMAAADGGIDWMFGFPSAPEDEDVLNRITKDIGAVIGGANKTQTIEEGELPYGGMLKVPVYLMTNNAHEAIVRDGVTYTFVVDANELRRSLSPVRPTFAIVSLLRLHGYA